MKDKKWQILKIMEKNGMKNKRNNWIERKIILYFFKFIFRIVINNEIRDK